MHRSWDPLSPGAQSVVCHILQVTARHHADPQWVTESHRTPLNVCVQHGDRYRVSDSKMKIKKSFFSIIFMCQSIVFLSHVPTGIQKYTQLAIFAVFKSLMFDWPYTKVWMFSHIHLWKKITDDYSLVQNH